MINLFDADVAPRVELGLVWPGPTDATILEGRNRQVAMRLRRVLVKVHRWLSVALLVWIAIVSSTGAWMTTHDTVDGWLHSARYRTTAGDVGPDAALARVRARLPDGATLYEITLPRNGRGVYQVVAAVPVTGSTGAGTGHPPTSALRRFFVDPGSGGINGVRDEEAGLTAWVQRGHRYLWQDDGIFGVFDPTSGWCRATGGIEPGGAKGIVCDIVPDGGDLVAWFSVGWMVVLLTGFHLWYWPGVRRWTTALVVRRGRGRFAFHMSLHKAVGFIVWTPLLIITVTGAAFAFPALEGWYRTATPAHRADQLWSIPVTAVSSHPDGRAPMGLDRLRAMLHERFPDRAADRIVLAVDELDTYRAWLTRGLSPHTREGRAGNTIVVVDQYTGRVIYDGTPEEGNIFDQAWSDWVQPLHTGDVAGTANRVVWVLLGLSPLVLATTGVTMNRVRRSKRSQRSRPREG